MIHGLEKTIETKIPGGSLIYTKRVKYCAVHGWFDLFSCGGKEGWEIKHASCGQLKTPAGIGLEIPRAMKMAA